MCCDFYQGNSLKTEQMKYMYKDINVGTFNVQLI